MGDIENIEVSLLNDLMKIPSVMRMFNPDNEWDLHKHAQIPSAFVYQFIMFIHHLNIISKNLDSEEAYIQAIWDFGANLNREVYSSVILRSWVILNRIENPDYSIPNRFRDNIARKTITNIKDSNKYNYFVEPLLFDIPIIEKIIKYSKNPDAERNIILKDLLTYFNSNHVFIIETWETYMKQKMRPKDFNSDYSINSYIKLLTPTSYFTSTTERERQRLILRGSLFMDTLILQKLDTKVTQLRLDSQQTTTEAGKITKLTENMSAILRNYYPNIHGGKKTRKSSHKIVKRKLTKKVLKKRTRTKRIKRTKRINRIKRTKRINRIR